MAARTIRERVIAVIAEQFGLNAENIKETDTIDSLGGDSLDAVECLMGLEEEFGCDDVDDEDSMRWTTVSDCVAYFEKLNQPKAEPVKVAHKKQAHPATVNAVKKTTAVELSPNFGAYAHRAEVQFKQAKFRFGTDAQKALKNVGDAEQKATDKILAAAVKADKLVATIVAENKAEAAKPVVQPILRAIHFYLVVESRGKKEVVAGPFPFSAVAREATRKYLMANTKVDPRHLSMRMGRELNHGKFTVAKDLRLPKITVPKVRTDARPKSTAKQIAQRKASQMAMNARRAVIRANRLVQTAIRIKSASLYVLDKRDRIVAGPFNTLKAAHEVCMGFRDQYVQSGARCRNSGLKYIKGFKPTTPAKVTGGMFAVGVPMMVAAVRTKITTYDAKTKTVCTALGTVHSCANFFINYSNVSLAVA